MEGGGCCGSDVGNGEGDRKEESSRSISLGLSLENYMDFCDDPLRRPDLVIDQLNHAEIMHTLEAMELMQALRSTLDEGISRCASLTLDEVRRDIQAIGWQGCPLGSVQSMGLPHGEDAAAAAGAITIASPVSAITIASPVSAHSAAAREEQKEKKRKNKKEEAEAATATADTSKKKRKRGRPPKGSFPLVTLGPAHKAASC
ncbi:hypothetical protein Taro_012778 [Colocasia esculenta]|uniref:Uncharacterized protein n=1 Tax=Colocasia esculenta TaxID=4460 RepID=A0A843U4S7_COLES|nr:hypothetical protein [Colocasia esculenta]